MDHYILDGKEPIRCELMQWAIWFQDANRMVCRTVIVPNEIEVSTVFLGLDHNFMGGGPPILFETMVFGGPRDQDQDRYATWDEAEAGHARIVEEVKACIEGTNVYEFKKTA